MDEYDLDDLEADIEWMISDGDMSEETALKFIKSLLTSKPDKDVQKKLKIEARK